MRQLAFSNNFIRQHAKLAIEERAGVKDTLKNFTEALDNNEIRKGFGFKKLRTNVFEIRVDIRLRLLILEENGQMVCHVVGTHNDIENFLKNY